MSQEVILHPLGITLALIFSAAMGGLLWWMLRVPPVIPPVVARARRSVEAIRRILVPTRGTGFDNRAIELACRLGQGQNAEIVLAYILEVPLTLPLGARLGEEEERAHRAIEEGKEIVRLHELTAIGRVERDRRAYSGLLRLARDFEVDLIVMGVNPRRGMEYDPLGPTTDYLLRHAPVEVILDRVPAAD